MMDLRFIGASGTQTWYQHGKVHREGDKPAVIYSNGYQAWYQHGKLHRESIDPVTGQTRPAFIAENGYPMWYKNGIRYVPKGT